MDEVFYDHRGRPTAYTEDGEAIYLYDGTPAAYIVRDSVYGYTGRHLGWLDSGWIRDHAGRAVFFTDHASGAGPVKPVRAVKPVKNVKDVRPVKGVRQVAPVKPVSMMTWSDAGDDFFD